MGIIAVVVILLAIAVILVPKILQRPIIASSKRFTTESGYPPPEITPTDGIPTVTFSVQPTVNPLTPGPPDGWPIDQPWPPYTATPKPVIPPAIDLFSTPAFTYLDEKVPDEELDRLWYPYRSGKNADIVLEEIKVDEMGKRKEKPNTKLNLGFGSLADAPRLLSLQKTSDDAYIAYQSAEREGAIWIINEISTGKSISTRQKFGFTLIDFYQWSPDGNYFLAHIDIDNLSSASLINIADGKRGMYEASEHDGILPEIDDVAFSPDGSLIAGALSYHPDSRKNNPWMNEISIWKTGDPSSREILCRVENGKDTEIHTLQWSPDGQKILWVGGMETTEVKDWVQYLWLADRSTGKCGPVAKMGVVPEQGYPVSGGFSADWSPDGSQVAFRGKEEKEGNSYYRIVLLDINTRMEKNLLGPTKDILSNVQFSPNGDFVTYSVSRIDYGEIWAVRLSGDGNTPIAGPTTINAPFGWDKKQK
jgi:WD40 repeat protein